MKSHTLQQNTGKKSKLVKHKRWFTLKVEVLLYRYRGTLAISSILVATSFPCHHLYYCAFSLQHFSAKQMSRFPSKMIFALLSLRAVAGRGGDFTWGEKLPGSCGWAGTKREAPLMCLPLCVHWGPGGESAHPRHSPGSRYRRTEHAGHGQVGALSAVGVAHRETSSCTSLGKCLFGSNVLSQRHSRNREPAMDRPHPSPRICTAHSHQCHEGTKSTPTTTSSEASTKGADSMSRHGISRSEACTGHVT